MFTIQEEWIRIGLKRQKIMLVSSQDPAALNALQQEITQHNVFPFAVCAHVIDPEKATPLKLIPINDKESFDSSESHRIKQYILSYRPAGTATSALYKLHTTHSASVSAALEAPSEVEPNSIGPTAARRF